MKLHTLALALALLPITAHPAPKYIEVAVNQLPAHITVEPSRLTEGWYGFSVKVNLKLASSPIDSWSAEIVLKNDKGYLLTAPIKPSPIFRNEKGQLLSASPAHAAEIVEFWSTIHSDLLKMARIELRDNDSMVVYEIRLSSSPGIK